MSRPKTTIKFDKVILEKIQEYANIITNQKHLEENGDYKESDELYFNRQIIERYLSEYLVKALNIQGRL